MKSLEDIHQQLYDLKKDMKSEGRKAFYVGYEAALEWVLDLE